MDFQEQLKQIKNHTFPKRDMIFVCNTSKILMDIGLDDLPIMMTQKHLYTITHKKGKYKDVNYHNLSMSIIKQIPNQIKSPLNILNSNTKEDSIVIVTDLKDENNRPIIIAIKRNGMGLLGDCRLNANILTSVYGRNNFTQFIESNKDKILYSKEKGIIKRVSRERLQLPMRTNSTKDSISKKQYSVNTYSMQDNEKYTIKETIERYGYYILELI